MRVASQEKQISFNYDGAGKILRLYSVIVSVLIVLEGTFHIDAYYNSLMGMKLTL